MATKFPISDDSPLALGRIPETERERLEALFQHVYQTQQTPKWQRAIQYFENAAYLNGNHMVRFEYAAPRGLTVTQFGVDDVSPWDSIIAKSADNRLLRPALSVAAMLTQVRPWPKVSPNSDLPEDEDAAKLAEVVLDLLWERPLRVQHRLREAALLAEIMGTAFAEIVYGPTDLPTQEPIEGEEIEENEILGGEVARPVVRGFRTTFKQDFQLNIWSPLHVTVDPAATSLDNARWIIRSTYEDRDWIAQHYASAAQGYTFSDPEELLRSIGSGGAETANTPLFWWARLQDILEHPQPNLFTGSLAAGTNTQKIPNQTLLHVVDVRPTPEYPRGRTLVFGGTTLLYAGDARAWSPKYPWRWHPYAAFSWFRMPGKFWGMPLLSVLVPMQKKINAIDALVQANRQHMAIQQWLLPRHAKVQEGRLGGRPGLHFTYTAVPGMPGPTPVQNAPLPAELLAERNLLVQAIEMVSASGLVGDEVSKSAARAGVMLDFLRNEKLRSLTPTIYEFEAFVESIAQNILLEVQLNLQDEDPELTARVRAAAREHSGLALSVFTGASLRDHHAVRIDIMSELMRSPEAREQKALEFFQATQGNVTPAERAGILKALGLEDYVKNPENATVQKVRRTLSAIMSNQPELALPIPMIEDPFAALPEVQRAILSERFVELNDKAREALFQLYTAYQQRAAEIMQQQMAMAAAAGGEGPAAGGGARKEGSNE